MPDAPIVPDYEGDCLTKVIPALLGDLAEPPTWLPAGVHESPQKVLLVIDGLGWHQLQARPDKAPFLSSMAGGSICTVAPSTTATAMTSLTTGRPPGEHGVVGYRIDVDGDILNILRWSTAAGDARATIRPEQFQPEVVFGGRRPPVVSKAEFRESGFTSGHLLGARYHCYRMTSTLLVEVRNLVAQGEPFVYAYYDGIDKVAHEYGLGEYYDAELAAVDQMAAELAATLPDGAALVVTADHGQVEVGDNVITLSDDLVDLIDHQSGEGRFRWLHVESEKCEAALETASDLYADRAWVCPVEQIVDEHWFGPKLTDDARGRLGEIALVARDRVAFLEPADSGPYVLIGRHGSLTPDEMHIPLLATVR